MGLLHFVRNDEYSAQDDKSKMKKYLTIVIVAIVVGGIGFYGGMVYGKNSASSAPVAGNQNFAAALRNRAGGQANGGLVTGEIIAKDDKSITVKTADGGSKIVFVSDQTSKVTKTTTGSLSDLIIGQNVVVSGSSNQDGSVTAQSVQLRPVPQGTAKAQ
jgi:cytochrome c-type biogenesis protein CcmE